MKEINLSNDNIVEKYLKMALENPHIEFNYNGTIIVNMKSFYDFIAENTKSDYINFEECLKAAIDRARDFPYGETCQYTLGAHETVSKREESINFEYDFDYDDEEDESSNYRIEFM